MMIFEKRGNLKYKLGNRHFWATGYYVRTVGLNEATIKKIYSRAGKAGYALRQIDYQRV